ncbi:MFS transporter [uncultured Schumannella sp.]|uniref:MFS transporter n=1 Tax=uncultured Schumannella sp. TaxID=1195956 RepID=UPI0025E50B58|nr:MFS transporter [uncultured Schumannella sp.]
MNVGLRSERGPVLLAVMVATAVVAIDATVLATAVPTIVADIGGFSSFPWLFSIYLLAQSVTVPVYSKLADTIGRKPIVLFGIAVFLLGSILCGIAWDMPSLIVFRAIQGLGAGAVLPITITIVGDIYSVQERAKVQGYIASVWAAAAVLGPTLGGLFAQLDAWRGIFWINVPLCLIAGWLLLKNYGEKREPQQHRIDFAGAGVLTVALVLILLGVLEGGNAWAWNSLPSIAVLAGGALLLVVFVVIERHAAEPVLPLPLLGRRIVWSTSVLGLAIGAVIIGLTAFIPTYLEGSIGVAPIVAGLSLATLTIGWPIAASLSGRVYLRWGFRATTIFGGVIVVLGTSALAFSVLAFPPSPWLVAALCFVVGLGMGFAAAPSLVAVQFSAAWNERGVVTGTTLFARTIGQAVGAAVLGAVANGVVAGRGGDETDPGTVLAASGAVFVAVAIVGVVLAALAFAMPRDRGGVVAAEPEPTETGPIATVG